MNGHNRSKENPEQNTRSTQNIKELHQGRAESETSSYLFSLREAVAAQRPKLKRIPELLNIILVQGSAARQLVEIIKVTIVDGPSVCVPVHPRDIARSALDRFL